MYATSAQALLHSQIHFLRQQQSILTAATIQSCQEKALKHNKKKKKSGHRVRTQKGQLITAERAVTLHHNFR